jgi:hypothetical protein
MDSLSGLGLETTDRYGVLLEHFPRAGQGVFRCRSLYNVDESPVFPIFDLYYFAVYWIWSITGCKVWSSVAHGFFIHSTSRADLSLAAFG